LCLDGLGLRTEEMGCEVGGGGEDLSMEDFGFEGEDELRIGPGGMEVCIHKSGHSDYDICWYEDMDEETAHMSHSAINNDFGSLV